MKIIIIRSLIIVIISGIIYYGIFLYQNTKVNKIQISYLQKIDTENILTEKLKEKYKLKRCNVNIFSPEYYQVSGGDSDALITFYEFNSIILNDLNSENLEKKYLGFSRVKNTTFPQLLKMVKKDCSQFQKPKGDRNDKDINWSYSKYEPKPKKTAEEIEKRRIEKEEKLRKIRSGELIRGKFNEEDDYTIEEIKEILSKTNFTFKEFIKMNVNEQTKIIKNNK